MLEYLKKLLAKRNAKLNDLKKRNAESEDLNEVRSLGIEISEVTEEIRGLEAQIADLEAAENNDEGTEERSANGFNPAATVATAQMNNGSAARSEDEDPRSTMEYRKAFMDYVQRGVVNKEVLQFEKRSGDQSGVAQDLGVLIPHTVIQKIIEGVEKVYGQLYSRVLKTNVQGGVEYPIGSFSATFHRMGENEKTDRQNAGAVTGSVTFTYKIGEIRIARSLLQSVLSVPVFEEKYAKVIVEAYVKAMDKEIMVGNPANKEMVGILTNHADGIQRIAAGNIIEFTAADMADWKTWQKKLFAKIPLSMRGLRPEFVMTANTYEANIKTLHDDNNRPVYNETYNPVDGTEISRFKGRDVVFVENDILKDFDDASNGEYFGMLWVPEEAYAINTNLEFTVREYFDEDLNQYVKKALVINDGKILDPKYIYLLKKKVQA